MEIVVHLGAPFRRIRGNTAETQPIAFLVGQLTECFVLQHAGPARVMGVRFMPAGTAPFLPFRLSDIQNEEVSLESLWGSAGRSLQDEVVNALSDDDRIRIFEDFLLTRFGEPEFDPRIDMAVGLIQSNEGRCSVTEISELLGWSPRHLERQFLSRIGIGPKTLVRTIRFQTLLKLIRTSSPPEWSTLALDCGFFDQAHLIREFKRFSGESPQAFFSQDYALHEFFATYDGMSDLSNT